jgi:hypothetical protein
MPYADKIPAEMAKQEVRKYVPRYINSPFYLE